MKQAFDFVASGFSFYIKVFLVIGLIFIVFPIAALVLLNSLTAESILDWSGWPYVFILIAVMVIAGIREWFKPVSK